MSSALAFSVYQQEAIDAQYAEIDKAAHRRAAPEVAAEMYEWCRSIGQGPTEICNAFGYVTVRATESEALSVLESAWLKGFWS